MGRISSLAVLQTRMTLELSACPPALLAQALMDGFHRFCLESEAWREELTMSLVDGQLDYTLAPSFDANCHRLVWVRINTADGVTDGLTPADLDPALYTMTPGDPDVLTLDDTLEPADDITDALTCKVVLVPEFNSMDVEEWFLNRYHLGILAKAMSLRMMDPNKRWTNASKAAIYEGQYLNQIQKARADLSREFKVNGYTLPM